VISKLIYIWSWINHVPSDLFFGREPFSGKNRKEVFDKNIAGRLEFPLDAKCPATEEALKLMTELAKVDPSSRPKALEALRHQWFQRFFQTSILLKNEENCQVEIVESKRPRKIPVSSIIVGKTLEFERTSEKNGKKQCFNNSIYSSLSSNNMAALTPKRSSIAGAYQKPGTQAHSLKLIPVDILPIKNKSYFGDARIQKI